jgi:amino acid adenylation domain-containing protein
VVANHADRLALKTADRMLRYTELNETANQIAHAVLALDSTANAPVAVLGELDFGMIAGIVGILKAGRICVPLNGSLPLSRIKCVLEDSEASVAVINDRNGSLPDQLSGGSLKFINVDSLDSGLPKKNLARPVAPDGAAWILYTSSSTGEPKGVVQTHRDELHNIMNMTNSQHLCADDRMTLLRTPSAGGAIRNAFSALLNGASLFLFDIRREALSGLAEWLIRERITIYHSSASVFRAFVHTLTARHVFPTVRLIRLGSEPVTWKDVELCRRTFSADCLLVNALSSTEARTFLQCFIDQNTASTGSRLPVGYPVEDLDVLLLDEDGRRLECGEIGEILIRSRYVFPGYWRRPDLTREVMSSDPDGGELRIFRTGDLGRMLPNGAFEHHGRKDFQLKISGQRLQLEAIEIELSRAPGVAQAVVMAQDWHLDKRLVAYVVATEGDTLNPREIREFLKTRLPEFMIPSFYMTLPSLPQGPSGKVDRNALPVPGRARPAAAGSFVAARDAVEQVLAQLWAEALSVDPVSSRDHFLDLGGNSLLASGIVSKINSIFSVHLTPRSLLEAATIGELAGILMTQELDPERASAIARTWLEIAQLEPAGLRAATGEKISKRADGE